MRKMAAPDTGHTGGFHGNLFGRIPSPERDRGTYPPQAASCRLRVLHLLEAIVQALITLAAVAHVPFGRIQLSASSAPCVPRRTFTKLYTSLTALNIHTAIRVRPQFNPECRLSKAHRNILHCRLAERKVIFAEIWRWLLKLDSKNYISIAACLSPGIQSGRAENLRIERHALLEDISIGGTG